MAVVPEEAEAGPDQGRAENRQLAQLASEWAPEQAPGLDTLRYFTTNVLKSETLAVDEQQLELLWQS